MEVFTPEHTAFLEGGKKEVKPATDTTISDDQFEKMSKKDLFQKAKEEAIKEFKAELDKDREARETESKTQVQREISAFARTHDDFEKFRPIMYGISLDPKYADATLQELYDASKEHIKRIHTEPNEEEKARQAKLKGEKPGGASESLEELKKLSPDEAAKSALGEVKKELGPLPPA